MANQIINGESRNIYNPKINKKLKRNNNYNFEISSNDKWNQIKFFDQNMAVNPNDQTYTGIIHRHEEGKTVKQPFKKA